MDELVSIISPCYNGAKYLPAFLDSVLSQTYSHIELIFVDDASTDDTANVLSSYTEKFSQRNIRLTYIHQEVNQGQAAAINKGLQIFQGEYLMWIDSDDIMFPSNVEEKIHFLNMHPECGFVLCQGEIVDENSLNTASGILKRKKPLGKDNLFDDLIYERNVVFGPGVIMVRRSSIRTAIPTGAIYESREGQNWQLMLPLAYNYKAGYIEKPLFKCVAHSDSHSRTKRTYEQKIIRQKNFQTLLKETIDGISQMPEQEKTKWKEIIQSNCVKNEFIVSIANFKISQSLYYAREISRLGGNPLQIILQKIKSKLKKGVSS